MMNDKEKFIILYLDDYVKMAYRRLTKKVNLNEEQKLVYYLYNLMDMYCEGELSQYIDDEEIV